MNQKIGLAIFPFIKDASPIARYHDMLCGYELRKIFTLKPEEQFLDANVLDGGTYTNITFTILNECNLDNIDVVLVLFDKNINKEVYLKYLELFHSKKIKILYEKKLQAFIDFNSLGNSKAIDSDSGYLGSQENSLSILKIPVPVIMVLGLGDQCNKFEIQLGLRDYFIKNGYKVSQIGTKVYSQLFGFNSLPDFLYHNIKTEEKIVKFNRYVKRMVQIENPDVVIIGVPDSIMKYNDRETNNFGIIPFIITNAVMPDIGILSIYQNGYSKEYFNELQNYCKYRYNCILDYINIANTRQVYDNRNKFSYFTLNKDYVLNNSNMTLFNNDEKVLIYNVFDENQSNRVYKHIETQLETNIEFLS